MNGRRPKLHLKLQSFGALIFALAVVAGPLGAVLPAPEPPCCCGDVCYMSCARDASGVDRHLGHGHEGSGVWQAESRCAASCPGTQAFSSAVSLAGGVEVSLWIPVSSSRLSRGGLLEEHLHPAFDPTSSRGPPLSC